MRSNNVGDRNSIRRFQYKYNGWNIEIGSTMPEQRQVYYIKILQNIKLKTDNINSNALKKEIGILIHKHILSLTTLNKKKHIEIIKLFDDWDKRKSVINNSNQCNWSWTTISMEIHLMRNEQYPNKLIKYYTNPKTGVKQKTFYTKRDYLLLFVDEIKENVDLFINDLSETVEYYNNDNHADAKLNELNEVVEYYNNEDDNLQHRDIGLV